MIRYKRIVIVSSAAFGAAAAAVGALNLVAVRPIMASWAAGFQGLDPTRMLRLSSGAYAISVGLFAAAAIVVWLTARPTAAAAAGGPASGLVWGACTGVIGAVLAVALLPRDSGTRAVIGYWLSFRSRPDALLALAVAAVVAPVAGELAFRGVLQAATTDGIGPAASVLATAVLYAFVWPLPGAWLPAFAVGALAGLAYAKSRHLLAPAIAATIATWGVFAAVAVFGPHWTR